MAAAASFFGVSPALAARLPMRGKGPNVYQRLGVEPFINLTSTRTMNGGAMLLPEWPTPFMRHRSTTRTCKSSSRRRGPYIAKMLGAPGAMICSGAAGALTSATLACMAGGDIETLQQLPNTEGIQDEVSWFAGRVRSTTTPSA